MAPPNILWLNCHDIGPDLGCYADVWPGAEYATSPELDRLAEQGVRYDKAFATTPVCAPSRSAVFSGMFPTAIGTMHHRSHAVPPPEVRCFPEYLRAAGYYCTNNWFTDLQFQTPLSVWDDCSPQAHWRNRADATQPFFAFFCCMTTHESNVYADDERHRELTRRVTPEQRHDPAEAPVPPYHPPTATFREAWARYSDNVTAMDAWAGDLLRELDEDGLASETIVVFWSDHGPGLPRGKRWPYDSGLRVPLLVRWPERLAPGTVRTGVTTIMDLAATMLTAAGLPVPAHMHARPLFDADGRLCPERPVVFGHRDRMDEAEDTIRTARDDRFRYVRNHHPDRPYAQHLDYAEPQATWRELRRLHADEALLRGQGLEADLLEPAQRALLATTKPPEELYDTHADPHEIANLAGDERYRAELERLRAALDEWQATYGDLGLLPEAELLERWQPDGALQVTAAPRVEVEDGRLAVTCPTAGASIVWTNEPPREAAPTDVTDVASIVEFGPPDTGGRSWRLYAEPFAPADHAPLWFRAQRPGFRASPDVEARLPAPAAGSEGT